MDARITDDAHQVVEGLRILGIGLMRMHLCSLHRQPIRHGLLGLARRIALSPPLFQNIFHIGAQWRGQSLHETFLFGALPSKHMPCPLV